MFVDSDMLGSTQAQQQTIKGISIPSFLHNLDGSEMVLPELDMGVKDHE